MKAVNINQIASIKLTLTLVVAVSLQSSLALSAFAQASDDSFLPPEVTPVSAAAANKMMQAQSQAMPAAQEGAVPGLVSSTSGANNFSNQFGGMNAGQIKKNFYNSLMGQGNYPQFEGNNGPISSKFGAPGGQAFSSPGVGPSPAGGPMQGPSGSQSLGQSNWNAAPQMASNSMPAQSQTLSGGVQNQTQSQSKRQGSGFSHGLSTLTGFGASAFAMGMMSRSNPAALYGVGLQGAAIGNYGMRNGFQF
jgi:hypothetical protein